MKQETKTSSSKYTWGTSFSWDQLTPQFNTYKRIRVKTINAEWVGTRNPIIIPFSINSAFHQGSLGVAKVKAFIMAIKQQVHGKITILLTEKAHMHADSLAFNNDLHKTVQTTTIKAKALAEQFQTIFQNCDVEYWHTLISQNPDYNTFYDLIMQRYDTDEHFRQLLLQDAQGTYTISRAQEFPHKDIYIANTIKDLLEQAIYLCIISELGYRFELYPGNPYASLQYINQHVLSSDKQIIHVPVFVAVDKK